MKFSTVGIHNFRRKFMEKHPKAGGAVRLEPIDEAETAFVLKFKNSEHRIAIDRSGDRWQLDWILDFVPLRLPWEWVILTGTKTEIQTELESIGFHFKIQNR
ncbi:hypothetical protein KC571_01290 [candidate division WWE3 bacterium]|uniref:Uncharacterized protein n=1 Tax=candidate division WWE3 bacterium TaxID=2053526 RepID=A0A955RQ14_UNCKA|nr:hypothetical protein [candidate division WWE3 bacterium]